MVISEESAKHSRENIYLMGLSRRNWSPNNLRESLPSVPELAPKIPTVEVSQQKTQRFCPWRWLSDLVMGCWPSTDVKHGRCQTLSNQKNRWGMPQSAGFPNETDKRTMTGRWAFSLDGSVQLLRRKVTAPMRCVVVHGWMAIPIAKPLRVCWKKPNFGRWSIPKSCFGCSQVLSVQSNPFCCGNSHLLSMNTRYNDDIWCTFRNILNSLGNYRKKQWKKPDKHTHTYIYICE